MNFQTSTNGYGFNLFLFPFAGGSSNSYTAFQQFLSPRINAVAFDLPGRGKRMSEPLLGNIDRVIDDMLNQVRSRLAVPYAFYGHSMGSLIGYLLVKRIIAEGLSQPVYLFFSGRGCPSSPAIKEKYHALPRKDFLDRLRLLGGCPDEMLDNREALEFFEPILRADFKVVETYQYTQSAPFHIPIHVMYGDEEDLSAESVDLWKKETRMPVITSCFSGNHFFIYRHAREIAAIINKQLTNF
jgi:surfactin synthase thioesterase subunit